MSRSYAFAQVDVFSATPFLGNPVAVILDAEGVTNEEMQRIARWTNLSETTFLLPASAPDADYRLRIFTPGGELPFAGHPTLGSAAAWLAAGGTPADGSTIVQECGAGLVRIRRDGEVLSFEAPPTLRSGPMDEEHLERVAAGFGIPRSAIIDHQWVDNGPGWAVVRLASAEEVLALEPDFSLLSDEMVGAIGTYPEGSRFAIEMRSFAPRGKVDEDPVCGSMNASVGQWLTSTGALPPSYLSSQGARLDRAGEISVSTDDAGQVWVGGKTTVGIQGTITL
ncbi:PhzF family phenazine biosynthesis protein [Microbacterium sp. NPDC055903]